MPLMTNCQVTVTRRGDNSNIVTNVEGFLTKDTDNSNGSYRVRIDLPDSQAEIGDLVTISGPRLLDGEWVVWLEPRISIVSTKMGRGIPDSMMLYLKRAKDVESATAKEQTGAQVNVHPGATYHQGNITISNSDFRGANLAISSRLEKVATNVGTMPGADTGTKQQVEDLLKQLNQELQNLPPEHADDINNVTKRVEALVAEAKEAKPDNEEIQTRSNSLKKSCAKPGGSSTNSHFYS